MRRVGVALLWRACAAWVFETPWSLDGSWRAPAPTCGVAKVKCNCNYGYKTAAWRPSRGKFVASFSKEDSLRTCATLRDEKVFFVGDSLVAQMQEHYGPRVDAACLDGNVRRPHKKPAYARCWDPQPTHAFYMLCDGCPGFREGAKKECTYAKVIDGARDGYTAAVVSFGAHMTTPERLGLTEAYSDALDALSRAVRGGAFGDAAAAVDALERLSVEGRVVDFNHTKTISISCDLAAAAHHVELRARERKWAVLLADAPLGHVGCFNKRRFNASLNPAGLSRAAWNDVSTQYKFGWDAIPAINDMASEAFRIAFANSPAPFVRLNANRAFAGHIQAHLASTGLQFKGGAKDCLHYCGKGPMHVYAEMIHNALLALGPPSQRFHANRTGSR